MDLVEKTEKLPRKGQIKTFPYKYSGFIHVDLSHARVGSQNIVA